MKDEFPEDPGIDALGVADPARKKEGDQPLDVSPVVFDGMLGVARLEGQEIPVRLQPESAGFIGEPIRLCSADRQPQAPPMDAMANTCKPLPLPTASMPSLVLALTDTALTGSPSAAARFPRIA